MRNIFAGFLVLVLASFVSGQANADAIGTVVATYGPATASGPGGNRVLNGGSQVFEKDKITVAGGNAQIMLLDTDLLESLAVNRGIAVTLKGGYHADYSSRSGQPSELNGPLTIRSGRLTADRVTVK